MRAVQFDENLNSKKLRRACAEEGIVRPIKFPIEMAGRSIPDEDVLQALLPRGNLLVTNDRRLVEDHSESVSDFHAGILIVLQDDGVIKDMTSDTVRRILMSFKSEFPEWSTIPWGNSVVRLTPSYIHVFHASSGRIIEDAILDRESTGWQEQFLYVLHQNAIRGSLNLAPADERHH